LRTLPKAAGALATLLAALVVLLGLSGPAAAQETATPDPAVETIERTPVPDDLPPLPAEYNVTAREALVIADGDAKVRTERDRRGELTADVTTDDPLKWEVGYFADGEKVVLVVIDGKTGEILESWTGEQVAWPMARGRTGQFGHILNAPYVWIPLALVFFLALFDFSRPWRIVHLDLLVLLSFGISHVFFNNAEIGVSVPLYYPPLVYLLARMLWVGFRGGEPLRPSLGFRWIVILCVLLAVFRVTISLADSGVIDVGYAGVIGADRITDAEPIYGEGAFPDDNPTGDTYGPANYFAYVPFEQIFPWSGSWDTLPAARAAAIFFDLLTVAGLALLGFRLAGRRLGAILALVWLAYPYSAFVLQSNSNDALISAAIAWALAFFALPLARGALLATAAAAKFAPLVLAPLFVVGEHGLWDTLRRPAARRRALLFAAAFTVAAALFIAHPAIDPGLSTFYDRTIGMQAERVSPFSIWGQTDLGWLHTLVKAFAVALALLVAFVPRQRDMRVIGALGAAVMIAVELTAEHWFYLYIAWFLPLLILALAYRPEGREQPPAALNPPVPGSG
jgi:hypothetical protein